MNPDALVVAGIVERDLDPRERLADALLVARTRLDLATVPSVRPPLERHSSHRSVFDDFDVVRERRVDELVVRGRRVRVAVAEVAAPDDACRGKVRTRGRARR